MIVQSPTREIIDLTQNEDDDSAFTASTIVINPPEVMDNPTPTFLINRMERSPFRAFIKVTTMPLEMVPHMLRNEPLYFLRVWPLFDSLIKRTFYYAKSSRHNSGFASYILKSIIDFHEKGENKSDYDSDAHVRKAFTTSLLIFGHFPREIGNLIVRQWRLQHFSNNITWWQMVIGVKRIISSHRDTQGLPAIHEEVDRLVMNNDH